MLTAIAQSLAKHISVVLFVIAASAGWLPDSFNDYQDTIGFSVLQEVSAAAWLGTDESLNATAVIYIKVQ